MEFLNGSSSSSSSSSTITSYQTQKVEPGFNLLEECWFFGNLLTSAKPKMSRCNSDPFPSTTSTNQQDNAKSLPSSANNGNNFVQPTLVRAPSLPTSFMMPKTVESIQQNGGHDFSAEMMMKSKAEVLLPRHTLLRAPSLPVPPCVGSEDDDEEEDQESDFKLGRLIRQASLNSSQTLPPRQTSKTSSVPRRPRKKVIMVGNKETGQQYQINKTKGQWPSDLQKLKALSSQFEKQSLDDDVSNKVASNSLEEKKATRPYQFSDASSWHNNGSTTTTIPKWSAAAADESVKRLPQDMKAQIKFWARAVASNARAPGVS